MEIVFLVLVLVFSVVFHEVSHGVVAFSQGDPTAKEAGRLTLNPIPHLDPIGSLVVPAVLIFLGAPVLGWAKPVPVNPAFFRDQRYGNLKVSVAGVGANFALALAFGLLLRFLLPFQGAQDVLPILRDIVFINLLLGTFNLVPIPPLDGSHVLFTFLSDRFFALKAFLFQWGFFVLLGLIFLVPGFFFAAILFPILSVFRLVVGVPLFAVPGIL